MKKGKNKWLTAVLGALSVVLAVAGTGLLGPAAQRAVQPAADVLVQATSSDS